MSIIRFTTLARLSARLIGPSWADETFRRRDTFVTPQKSGFRPNFDMAFISGAALPSGLELSGEAQGRNLPEPRSALSLPFSTTTLPRLMTVTGQPLIWRPSYGV